MKKLFKKLSVASLFLLTPVMLTACTGDNGGETPEEPTKYTITVDTLGGTTVESYTGLAGDQIEAPLNPTKKYFTFAGWFSDKACTQAYTFTAIPEANVTVYAKWIPMEASLINFVSNGGSKVDSIYGTEGEKIDMPTNPTKAGCTFEGWYTDEALTKKYTQTTYGKDVITLYAKWTQNAGAYYVTYHVGDNVYEKYMEDSKVVFDNTIIPEDSTVSGWYLDSEYQMLATDGATLTSSIDLYASVYTNGLKFDGNKVVGYEGNAKEVLIPAVYNGVAITEIAPYAFFENKNITSVYIPDNVTTIGDYAFYNAEYLVDALLPAKLNTLGEYAFFGCKRLKDVESIGDVTVLAQGVFSGCDVLKEFAVDKVVEVKDYALAGCKAFDELTFASVISIGDYALMDLTSLTKLTLSKSVESIGNGNFVGVTAEVTIDRSNTNFKINNYGLVSADEKTLYKYLSQDSEVVLANLTTVLANAFDGNTTIKKLDLSGVATINKGALTGIKELEELTLNTMDTYVSYYFGAENALDNGTNNQKVSDSLNKIIYKVSPSTVLDYAFYGIKGLKNVVGLDNVEEINKYAFAYTSIDSFTIAAHTLTVANNAFYQCKKLSSINVEEANASYKSIDGCVYDKAGTVLLIVPSNKGDVKFAESANEIAAFAFEGARVEKLVIPSTITKMNQNALTGILDLISLSVPYIGDGDQNQYMQYLFGASMVEKTNTNGETYNTVTNIENVPSSINNLEITGEITEIPEYAFAYFRNLSSIVYPGTVTNIGSYAYAQTGIKTIVIPESVTEVGEFAFAYCFNLEEASLSAKVIGDAAFAYTFRLAKITFNEGVEAIPDLCCYPYREADQFGVARFYSSLKEINIATSVKSIGDSAFVYAGVYGGGAEKVENDDALLINFVDIENSKLETIGDEVFSYSAVNEVYLPASLVSTGTRAFGFCQSLTKVQFGNKQQGSKLQSIGPISFCFAEELESVTIYKNVVTDEDVPQLEVFMNGAFTAYPFYQASSKAKLYVPSASVSLYKAVRAYTASFGTNNIVAIAE